jgi:signal transduction histidine kinase
MEASLHIGISNDEIGMLLAESQEESISVIVAISVFCLIGAILIGQRISKPLQDLTRQLYRFGETGAIQKVEVETSDADVHALINEFNRMVDKRVQAESALQRALGDARQANEAKSLFLAAMSHEFRTPLNAIIGFSDILTSQPFGQNDRGKYHEYAKDIHSSGQYLLDLVNDILDLSAIEAGKRALDIRKVEIDTILSDASGVVNRIAEEKNITLTVGPLDRCPPILADGLAVRQILFNLLSNAVKFTPEGGRVDLSVSNSNDQVTFRIVDTGQGIPADKLETITDPFTKGEHDPYVSAEGWGLGLSITKSLVDLHGGSLTIESAVGSGTIVSVSLPLEPPATPYPAS